MSETKALVDTETYKKSEKTRLFFDLSGLCDAFLRRRNSILKYGRDNLAMMNEERGFKDRRKASDRRQNFEPNEEVVSPNSENDLKSD
jgi:hypothetical protein